MSYPSPRPGLLHELGNCMCVGVAALCVGVAALSVGVAALIFCFINTYDKAPGQSQKIQSTELSQARRGRKFSGLNCVGPGAGENLVY